MYTYRLAHGLAAAGHVVHVITEVYGDDEEYFDGEVRVHRIRNWHIFSDVDRFPEWNRRFEYGDRVAQKIKDIHMRYGLHIVESPNYYGEAYLYTLFKDLPVVTRLNSTHKKIIECQKWKMTEDARLSCLVEERLIEKSDVITCSTKAHADKVLGYNESLRSRINIIPFGISLPPVSPEKKRDCQHILFVGRLERRKGIDVLIEALPDILRNNPDVLCDVVGRDTYSTETTMSFEGEKQHSYMQMLKNMLPEDLRERVTFHGYVNETDLEQFYKNCDVFVAPSRYESCGFVYLEAMSYGKPVIGCNVGGVPEMITHGETGMLVEPDNKEALMVAITDLLQDKEQRIKLGSAAREYVEMHHSTEKMVSMTEVLYRSLL